MIGLIKVFLDFFLYLFFIVIIVYIVNFFKVGVFNFGFRENVI